MPDDAPSPTLLYRGEIAGRQFYAYKLRPDLLKHITEVVLVPEPENEHDRRAIRVDTPGGKKIGYIPRKQTAPIHKAISERMTLRTDLKVMQIGHSYTGQRLIDAQMVQIDLQVRGIPRPPPPKAEFGKTIHKILLA